MPCGYTFILKQKDATKLDALKCVHLFCVRLFTRWWTELPPKRTTYGFMQRTKGSLRSQRAMLFADLSRLLSFPLKGIRSPSNKPDCRPRTVAGQVTAISMDRRANKLFWVALTKGMAEVGLAVLSAWVDMRQLPSAYPVQTAAKKIYVLTYLFIRLVNKIRFHVPYLRLK